MPGADGICPARRNRRPLPGNKHGYSVAGPGPGAAKPGQGAQLSAASMSPRKSTRLNTRGAVGEFTPEEALAKLLAGTGLTFKYLNEHTVTILPVAPPTPARERPINTDPGDQRVPRISKPSIVKNVRLASRCIGRHVWRGERPCRRAVHRPRLQDLEEVIVTGIRSSLRQAMEIKRDSDQIVDSIASRKPGQVSGHQHRRVACSESPVCRSIAAVVKVRESRCAASGRSSTPCCSTAAASLPTPARAHSTSTCCPPN